jgi:hypothetical protein
VVTCLEGLLLRKHFLLLMTSLDLLNELVELRRSFHSVELLALDHGLLLLVLDEIT